MDKKEAIQLLNESYIPISKSEYDELYFKEENCMRMISNKEYLYFKPIQKFPIKFGTNNKKILVHKDGNIEIKHLGDSMYFHNNLNIPELEKAIKKSKELQ